MTDTPSTTAARLRAHAEAGTPASREELLEVAALIEGQVNVVAEPLWMLLDNPTGNLTEAACHAVSPDPKALVLWHDPETQPGDWKVTRCINGDLYESPCGRYCITAGPIFVLALPLVTP